MKLILDTNIFVAAGFNPRSRAAGIVAAVRRGEHTHVWNRATRRETEKILAQIPPLRGQDFGDLFAERDEFRGPTEPERFGLVPDPDDRKFAALAAASGAVLVSNDSDLLAVRERLGIPVKSPGELAEDFFPRGGER